MSTSDYSLRLWFRNSAQSLLHRSVNAVNTEHAEGTLLLSHVLLLHRPFPAISPITKGNHSNMAPVPWQIG